jgi:hypothetical protein
VVRNAIKTVDDVEQLCPCEKATVEVLEELIL